MGWLIVALVAAEDCDWNITVLDEAAPVQPSIEAITEAVRLFDTFRISAMTVTFATQQAQGLSHLRLRLVDRPGIANSGRIRNSGQSFGLIFAAEILEAKF
jgi:hypothetical protein